MKRRSSNKFFGFLLSFIFGIMMFVSLVPVSVFAIEEDCSHTNAYFTEGSEASCFEPGTKDYWFCEDCYSYLDESKQRIPDEELWQYPNELDYFKIPASGHAFSADTGKCEYCGIPNPVYSKVTSLSELNEEDMYIIVAEADGQYFALGGLDESNPDEQGNIWNPEGVGNAIPVTLNSDGSISLMNQAFSSDARPSEFMFDVNPGQFDWGSSELGMTLVMPLFPNHCVYPFQSHGFDYTEYMGVPRYANGEYGQWDSSAWVIDFYTTQVDENTYRDWEGYTHAEQLSWGVIGENVDEGNLIMYADHYSSVGGAMFTLRLREYDGRYYFICGEDGFLEGVTWEVQYGPFNTNDVQYAVSLFRCDVPAVHTCSFGDWVADEGENTHTRLCNSPSCGKKESAPHVWDDGTESKAPTCVDSGEMCYTCGDCGATNSETIPAIGHDWDEWQTYEATCTEDGYRECLCGVCGENQREGIPALGHDYSKGVCVNCGEFAPDYIELKITRQPKSVLVSKGDVAEVTVNAIGDGLTYKWYYKNVGSSKFVLTTAFSGDTYSVEMTSARNGRQLYCVITDKYGNEVKTDTVTLQMATTVKITTQPKSVTVAPGKVAKVTVQATGDGLIYKWYFKNASASKFSLTKSFTGNTYTVEMDDSRDGRQVYCVITDKYGNEVKTNTVTLKMAEPAKITTQPKSVKVTEGENAKVTVKASGDGLTYKWYFKNAGASKFALTKAFTGNTYTVEMNDSRDGRQVYCVVTDKYGNKVTSKTVTISMAEPAKITTQPKSVKVAEDENAKVTVKATGDGLTYKWYYKNPGSSKFSLTTSFTGNTYTVKMNDSRDGRQVYCVVTDKYGNTVKTKTVTLSMEKHAEITTQPKSVAVAKGETAKITVKAAGDGLTYKWYFKNAGDSKFKLTTTFTGNTYTAEMNATRNGRQVYCVITDVYGNTVRTETVTLTAK